MVWPRFTALVAQVGQSAGCLKPETNGEETENQEESIEQQLQRFLCEQETIDFSNTPFWDPHNQFLKWPPSCVSEKLTSLTVGKMNIASFQSLKGSVPNLKHLKCVLYQVHSQILDAFFESAQFLESIEFKIYFCHGEFPFKFSEMEQFWNLESLTSLVINHTSVASDGQTVANEEILRKIAISFQNMHTLKLPCVDFGKEGLTVLRHLKNLQNLELEENMTWKVVGGAQDLVDRCPDLKELHLPCSYLSDDDAQAVMPFIRLKVAGVF